MPRKITKILASFLSFLLLLQQASFAEMAVQLNLAGHLASLHQAITVDKFRPLHLRYLEYLPQDNSFKLLIDKGSFSRDGSQEINKDSKRTVPKNKLESTSKELFKYFLIGLTLPNESFWVNLRPDSPDNIIDPYLEKTDIGRIMLETDLELKKDTAKATSPDTKEGKEYWEKLYKKADELFPNNPNITIPTLTRPWIVPDEIIVRESNSSAYVYKATLKVMLEEDYLKNTKAPVGAGFKPAPTSERSASSTLSTYSFTDPRLKQLNKYSTQLIKELIIPKLTLAVNTSKKYSELRQVYYSLILAQWFKARYANSVIARNPANGGMTKQSPLYKLINSKDLTNLITSKPFSKETYFNQYKDSFAKGEYNYQEPAYTMQGKVIRRYFSGGMELSGITKVSSPVPAVIDSSVFSRFAKTLIPITLSFLIGTSDIVIGQNMDSVVTTPIITLSASEAVYMARQKSINANQSVPYHDKEKRERYSGNALLIYTGEGGVRKNNGMIATDGIGPCVVVTLYDKNNKAGAMVHLLISTPAFEALDIMLDSLKREGANLGTLEARVIGGRTRVSNELVFDIYKYLGQRKIPIVEKDILGFQGVRNIALDINTGKLYDYDYSLSNSEMNEMDRLYRRTKVGPIFIKERFLNPKLASKEPTKKSSSPLSSPATAPASSPVRNGPDGKSLVSSRATSPIDNGISRRRFLEVSVKGALAAAFPQAAKMLSAGESGSGYDFETRSQIVSILNNTIYSYQKLVRRARSSEEEVELFNELMSKCCSDILNITKGKSITEFSDWHNGRNNSGADFISKALPDYFKKLNMFFSINLNSIRLNNKVITVHNFDLYKIEQELNKQAALDNEKIDYRVVILGERMMLGDSGRLISNYVTHLGWFQDGVIYIRKPFAKSNAEKIWDKWPEFEKAMKDSSKNKPEDQTQDLIKNREVLLSSLSIYLYYMNYSDIMKQVRKDFPANPQGAKNKFVELVTEWMMNETETHELGHLMFDRFLQSSRVEFTTDNDMRSAIHECMAYLSQLLLNQRKYGSLSLIIGMISVDGSIAHNRAAKNLARGLMAMLLSNREQLFKDANSKERKTLDDIAKRIENKSLADDAPEAQVKVLPLITYMSSDMLNVMAAHFLEDMRKQIKSGVYMKRSSLDVVPGGLSGASSPVDKDSSNASLLIRKEELRQQIFNVVRIINKEGKAPNGGKGTSFAAPRVAGILVRTLRDKTALPVKKAIEELRSQAIPLKGASDARLILGVPAATSTTSSSQTTKTSSLPVKELKLRDLYELRQDNPGAIISDVTGAKIYGIDYVIAKLENSFEGAPSVVLLRADGSLMLATEMVAGAGDEASRPDPKEDKGVDIDSLISEDPPAASSPAQTGATNNKDDFIPGSVRAIYEPDHYKRAAFQSDLKKAIEKADIVIVEVPQELNESLQRLSDGEINVDEFSNVLQKEYERYGASLILAKENHLLFEVLYGSKKKIIGGDLLQRTIIKNSFYEQQVNRALIQGQITKAIEAFARLMFGMAQDIIQGDNHFLRIISNTHMANPQARIAVVRGILHNYLTSILSKQGIPVQSKLINNPGNKSAVLRYDDILVRTFIHQIITGKRQKVSGLLVGRAMITNTWLNLMKKRGLRAQADFADMNRAASRLNLAQIRKLYTDVTSGDKTWGFFEDYLVQLANSSSSSATSTASSPVRAGEKIVSLPLDNLEAPRNDTGVGGIDLRFLPIITQAMTNLSSSFRLTNDIKLKLSSVRLDEEWSQIERLVDSEITPSSERIKEYIQAACVQDRLNQDDVDKIILCIADTLRCDEGRCSKSDPALMDILIVLESQKTPQQLSRAFLGIPS